jgi:putative membrane protein
VLGFFTLLRQKMAAPLMALLTGLLLYHWWHQERGSDRSRYRRQFAFWALSVFILAFAIEWLGVKSGNIFGSYHYGPVLQPQIDSVPMVIGLAWVLMLTGSAAVAEWLMKNSRYRPEWLMVVVAAALMVLFDGLMEPAAVKLGYWSWREGSIPLQNYLAWLIISVLFILFARALRLFDGKEPRIARHIYWAQLIYFAVIAAADF